MTAAKKYADLYKASSAPKADEAALEKKQVMDLIKVLQGNLKDPELAKKAAQILSEWVNKNSSNKMSK